MSKTFSVSIVVPGKAPIKMDAESVITLTSGGKLEFRANHAPIITNILPNPTLIVNEGKKEQVFTSAGIIYMKKNELKICCDSAELASEVDVNRAQASKDRAEKRLKENNHIDVERAQRALSRALARIETVNRK